MSSNTGYIVQTYFGPASTTCQGYPASIAVKAMGLCFFDDSFGISGAFVKMVAKSVKSNQFTIQTIPYTNSNCIHNISAAITSKTFSTSCANSYTYQYATSPPSYNSYGIISRYVLGIINRAMNWFKWWIYTYDIPVIIHPLRLAKRFRVHKE